MLKISKALSPIAAIVIIIAIVLALTIAIVGWVIGIWSSISSGTELLKIMPDSYIDVANRLIILHVKNEGGAAAIIYRVEIAGLATATAYKSDSVTSALREVHIEPGDDLTLIIPITSGSLTQGAIYTIKVYTTSGNVYATQVVAR